MGKILINQSLIKKFYYKGELRDYCAVSINASTIAKTHERTSLSMDSGSYFETLCLGGGANNSTTHDLPRKKLTVKQILLGKTIGEKTIAQVRIEQQALIFERQKAIYQINVQKEVNTQVRIYKQWSKNDDIIIHGEHDIFPTTILLPERGLRLGTIDLKLTAGFTDYGEFCWATPSAMDHTQGYMYHELGRDIDMQLNMDMMPDSKLQYLYTGPMKRQIEEHELLFFYWVFTYKEVENKNKFIEVPWTKDNRNELNESIRKTVEQLNKNERENWQGLYPSPNNCSNCPILDCPSKVSFNNEKVFNNFESV